MNGGLMMTFARESQRGADGETTAKLRPFLSNLILGHSHRLQRRRFQKLFPESAGPVSSQAFCTFQNLLTIGSRLLREIIRIRSRNFPQNPLLPWELSVCWIQIAHFISRSTWTKFCQTIGVCLSVPAVTLKSPFFFFRKLMFLHCRPPLQGALHGAQPEGRPGEARGRLPNLPTAP